MPEAVRRAERAGEAAAELANHWTETYGIRVGTERHMLLTPDLQAFLSGCRATNRHAVLMTDPDASLSPFVVQAMRDAGAFWVLYRGSGPILDARSGTELHSYEQLWWEGLPESDATPTGKTPVLAFEVYAEHRADERTRIGDVLSDLLPLLGGAGPEQWGLSEPLEHAFLPNAITGLARTQMPETEQIYVSDAVGSYADLTVSRIKTGLRERLRGGVVRRLGAKTPAEMLTAVAGLRHRVVIASLSELRMHPGPRWHAGPRHTERMVAAYLGPTALGRAELDPQVTAARHGGVLVGRTQLPGVVVTFTGTPQERAHAHRSLIEDIARGGNHDGLEA